MAAERSTVSPIFISHATADDAFVAELREALEGQGLPIWVDSRNLRGGAKLAPEISEAIREARQVLVVLSPQTINSPWVRREIQQALAVERDRQAEGYRVIPVLLPGVEPSALENWFDEEPVGVKVELKTGGVAEALAAILAALGEREPEDQQVYEEAPAAPVAELMLRLTDAGLAYEEGRRKLTATARLTYDPADPNSPTVESQRFRFTAPLGPIEIDDLRWYLEEYFRWPTGLFRERATRVENTLPEWGQALHQAALAAESAQEALRGWHGVEQADRRFSVLVEADPPEGTPEAEAAVLREAGTLLLGLPWELLHDGGGYLFQGRRAARVRRRLPGRILHKAVPRELPVRILLASPRPEDQTARYIDHRASALPLVEAVEGLGDLVELTVLEPPTLGALRQALEDAAKRGAPFDVIHFDGHGVYDKAHGLGTLCFEAAGDADKLTDRRSELVDADELAALIRDHRIPLMFLEACQSAAEADPTASVAARVLEEGTTSVVAMSHSVLVETARRFVAAFYSSLARGARVGGAMLTGQQALHDDRNRGRIMGAGELELQDWFVPVLYQEEQDPQLVTELPPATVEQLQAQQRKLSLGELPEPPPHKFHGRSHELLALERLLARQPYAVVVGQGGQGKTALAAELARWRVRSNRCERVAFVCLEDHQDGRSVIDSLGRQLLPSFSVAEYEDENAALQPIERALRDRPTLLLLDNMESVLPPPGSKSETVQLEEGAVDAEAPEVVDQGWPVGELWKLCERMLEADRATRLVFTSRECLPAPFDHARRQLVLGPLRREEAIELVGQVMANEGWEPPATDPGSTPQEIRDLVEAVGCHARALVALAREVARRGVNATTAELGGLMRDLEERHPGERERSLFASVELSLRRLPAELRQAIRPLGVFQGGAHLAVIGQTLGVEPEAAAALGQALIGVGLASDAGGGHFRLDPALAPYLWAELEASEREVVRVRWAESMRGLVQFLYDQRFQDTALSAQLTVLELPNLLTLLPWLEAHAPPEQVVSVATSLEAVLAPLGRARALERVVQVRAHAMEGLGERSHARFEGERAEIERMLAQGNLPAALAATRELLRSALAAGEDAYPGAAYDIAGAHFFLGRVLHAAGRAEEGLQTLSEAQRRFQVLADAGGAAAERMVGVAVSEQGDCLIDLGRLEAAVVAYEEAIRRAQARDDPRSVAVGKGQLATVRLMQRRYKEALEGYAEAREHFERLGEPAMVATAWHQIGLVHQRAGSYDLAERAYRESMGIKVREKDKAGEASSLSQLGSLYDAMGLLEDAVGFFRQAVSLRVELKDLRREGTSRYNLADTLRKLRRYDEARSEIERAIECDRPFGHTAEPWKTWETLRLLEQQAGNAAAAVEARRQAIAAYLSYRRDGGENQNPGGRLGAFVLRAIRTDAHESARGTLAKFSGSTDEPWAQAMIPRLHAILDGSRDPALAEDPALDYDDAAELALLLERLEGGAEP